MQGAVRCLLARGYARTTARDVANEAGVSLAAIGYHYGTIDHLLSLAFIRAIELFAEELETTVADTMGEESIPERFRSVWANILAHFAKNPALWRVNIEVLTQVEPSAELRQTMIRHQYEARIGLATLFHGPEVAHDIRRAEAVGAVYQALLLGLLSQWLVDPAKALSADDLTHAVQFIATEFAQPAPTTRPARATSRKQPTRGRAIRKGR